MASEDEKRRHRDRTDTQIRMTMTEAWRPVRGYVNQDEVSSLGRVRSLPRVVAGRKRADGSRSERRLAGQLITLIVNHGKHSVNLWTLNSHKQIPVRRIVLEAFDGPQPVGHDAINVNADRGDNRPGEPAVDREYELTR
jgi:hypothetical protein